MSRRSRRRSQYANMYAPRGRWGRQPVPLLMYRDDDPILVELFRAMSRALWRYRSEMMPLYIGFGVWEFGGWLHSNHSGSAFMLAVLAVIVSGALFTHDRWVNPVRARVAARAPNWSRWPVEVPGWLQRPVERLYVAALVGAVGMWWAGVALWGTGSGFLTLMAWGLLFGGGMPWWTHHRRRARVRVERTIEAWPETAQKIGLPMSVMQSAVVDSYGWTARVVLSGGQTFTDAVARIPAIESILKVRAGSIRIEPTANRADQITIRVVEIDPHAKPLVLPDRLVSTPAGVHRRSITGVFELGLFEDAEPVLLRLASRHILIGGVVGAGKSGVLNVFLAQLSSCVDAVMVGIDLKGGMELKPWAESMAWVATTQEHALRLLAALADEVNRRASVAAERHIRTWEPTIEEPAVIIVIDEYAEMDDDAKEFVDSIARLGRAVAVTLLIATQRPTQDAMGQGAVRSQMDIRIGLRVRERRDADLIFGQGMLAAGWAPQNLDAPGKFLLSSPEHTMPKRARAYLVDDERVRIIASVNTAIVRKLPLQFPAADRPGPRPVSQVSENRSDRGGNVAAEPETPTGQAESDENEESVSRKDGTLEAAQALWAALLSAPEDGISVPDLMAASGGMSRPWVYKRLSAHQRAGEAVQVSRGRWRASKRVTSTE